MQDSSFFAIYTRPFHVHDSVDDPVCFFCSLFFRIDFIKRVRERMTIPRIIPVTSVSSITTASDASKCQARNERATGEAFWTEKITATANTMTNRIATILPPRIIGTGYSLMLVLQGDVKFKFAIAKKKSFPNYVHAYYLTRFLIKQGYLYIAYGFYPPVVDDGDDVARSEPCF
jgi:hypothetical protein